VSSGTSGYAVVDGLRLHYVEWGQADRPPVVLLHGLRAYGHWFDEFADVAEGSYRLIALDQRGRGSSDWAKDGVYNTDAYVADLTGLVDQLRLDRFTLIGHSMGGTNAINFAARYPERVAALVIVDSAPELDPRGLHRIRSELGATPKTFASWDEARAFIRRLHVRPSEQHIATRLAWMLKEAAPGQIAWRLDEAIFDPRMTPDPPSRTWSMLAEIRCPTLLVRGGVSDIVTAEMAERVAAAVPGARWVEVPEAGHMVLEDNPPGFNAAVMAFLAQAVPAQATSPAHA
jgi:pimeloyl-ACP methyl ester carboxylesterase